MKVRKTVLTEELEELTLEQLIRKVLHDEEYFLDYTDTQKMYDEFFSWASDFVIDEEELDKNKEEIIRFLIEERDRINQQNYDRSVRDLTHYLREVFIEDYCSDCDFPVYGEAKAQLFSDAIANLYNKYCNAKELE